MSSRNVRFLLFTFTVALLLVGCAQKTLVGKWNGEVSQGGQKLQTVMEFKGDGTLTQKAKSAMGEINATGSYKTEGENLTITVKEIHLGDKSLPLPTNTPSQQATYKLDNDTLAITRNGQTISLQRIKE